MRRILIVDDELKNQFYLKKLCELPDVTIHTANNGKEAIDLCNRFRFDLLFMDINMPNMSGPEVLIQIRNLESDYFHRTPIIAISSNYKQDEPIINEFDFDETIHNPIREGVIKDIINKYLIR